MRSGVGLGIAHPYRYV